MLSMKKREMKSAPCREPCGLQSLAALILDQIMQYRILGRSLPENQHMCIISVGLCNLVCG